MFDTAFYLAVTSVLLLSAFGSYTLYVWTHRKQYTKEHFALASLASIVTITTAFFAAISSPTPWDLLTQLVGKLSGDNVHPVTPSPTVYVLLTFAYVISSAMIFTMFRRWDGLRSERQHSIEQRRADMSLFLEGLKELLRLLSLGEPPKIHQPTSQTLPPQLQPSTYSVPWRDRARSLIQLKSPFYAFPDDTDWHEQQQCWVGTDLNTGDRVMLRCAPDDVSDRELSSFVAYADRIRAPSDKPTTVLILAIENAEATPIDLWDTSPIQFETERTLLDHLVNWSVYNTDISKRMTQVRLPDSNLTTADVFVEPKWTQSGSDDNGRLDLTSYVTAWLDDRDQRQLALLGDYGQGKSTAVLAFTHRQLASNRNPRIPLLIELRGTSPRNLTPLQLLGAWGAKFNINPQALLHLHVAGRLLLIFDGFDEMALVGDTEMRLKHFNTLWQFCLPAAKILITGRPNFFFDEAEMIAALGISAATPGKPYCEAIRLTSFDLEQIRVALRHHDGTLRDEIVEFAKQNDQFRELISRPSLLHIVAVLWRKEDLSSRLNELTSAYVMRLFIRQSYRRQGQKEHDGPDFMALTNEERHYFMRGIATYMAAKRLPNQITGQQLNEAIVSLIETIPEDVSRRSSAITGETRKPLRSRLEESEHGTEHVQTDVRTCGLLVDDPSAPGAFRFGHKSFMEYLVAEVVGEQISDSERPDAAAILKACDANATDIEGLPASINFLSEILERDIEDAGGSKTGQKTVAKRILRLLLGQNPFSYTAGRLFLYQLALIRTSKNLPLILRIAVPSLLGLYFPWFILVAMLILGASRADTVSLIVGFSSGILGASLGLLHQKISGHVFVVGSRTLKSAIFVWNRLCKELGLSDQALFEIAGVGWLPWTRNQTFALFREEDDRGR